MERQQQDLQGIMELFKTAEGYINQGQGDISDPGPNCNMLLGMTRSGKSTLLNYLLGNELIAEVADPNAKGAAGKKLKVKLANQNLAGQAKIGHQVKSETTIPKKYCSSSGIFKQILFDNPGFGDNRGVAIDLSNALLISKLLKKAQNVRFLLAVDIQSISGDNIFLFITMIKQITSLFEIQILKNYACIVCTKVHPDYEFQDIVADLQKSLNQIQDPQFNKSLIQHIIQTRRICMFRKPMKKGPITFDNAQQMSQNILGIKPLQRIDLSKVRVSVSSQTRNIIYRQHFVILQYSKKELKQFLGYLDQLIDVNSFKTVQQGRQKQKQFNQLVESRLKIGRKETNLKAIVDRLHLVMRQYKINVPEQLMKSIESKVNLVDYIKQIIQLSTMQVDEFQNEISLRVRQIKRNVTLKINQLQVQEKQISEEQRQRMKARQDEMQKQFLQQMNIITAKMREMQQAHAKQLLQAQNDAMMKQQIAREQAQQIQRLREQVAKKKKGCQLI